MKEFKQPATNWLKSLFPENKSTVEKALVNWINSCNPLKKMAQEIDDIYDRAASWGVPLGIRNRVRRFCNKRRASTELDIFILKLWLSGEVNSFHLSQLMLNQCFLSEPFCFSELELLRERLKKKPMPFDEFLRLLEDIPD